MVYTFVFVPPQGTGKHAFRCKLACGRCNAKTRGGAGPRCKRRVCIGLPMCWTHTRAQGLLIADAGHKGKGLFAHGRTEDEKNRTTPVFRTGNLIAQYDAEIISESILKMRYGNKTAPYGLKGYGRDKFLDAACHRGVGSLANDPRGSGQRANARLVVGKNGASLRATKALYSGDEILVSYGKEYWSKV